MSLSASPHLLWPANHKLVAITIDATASDTCDAAPRCSIVGVTSNEPEDGTGDGDTGPDWIVDSDLGLRLRAERDGAGSGRVYSVTVACTDAAGQVGSDTVSVIVPKSKGKKK